MKSTQIIISQNCSYCYNITDFIKNNELYKNNFLDVHKVYIDFLHDGASQVRQAMTSAIYWYAGNVDETFARHHQVTPLMIHYDDSKIEEVIIGDEEIIAYLFSLMGNTVKQEDSNIIT